MAQVAYRSRGHVVNVTNQRGHAVADCRECLWAYEQENSGESRYVYAWARVHAYRTMIVVR